PSPRLVPSLAGYLWVDPPSGGGGKYFQPPAISPVTDFESPPEARRFENAGTANYPGAVGLAASLHLIHELGQENITRHVHELTDQLIAGLDALHLEVITPRAPQNRSGIVTFSVGSAGDNVKLMNHLLRK